MTECTHNWQLGHSTQFTWSDEIYGDKKTIFGNPKIDYKRHMRGRIDEFYCSKCIETRIKKRESAQLLPIWWRRDIEPTHSEWGRPTEMWHDDDTLCQDEHTDG